MLQKSETQSNYLIQLDGLRCMAVLLVLIDHWLAERNKLPLGALGVTLFFVLSGFLITGILLKSKLKDEATGRSHWFSFKQFYIRRSLRIFPIYYLSVFALIAANSPSVQGKISWHLLYGTNLYIAINETWMGITDHFWSLAVEEQFYLFFPLLVFVLPTKYLFRTFIALIFLAVTIRLYLFFNHFNWSVQYVSMPTCLDSFGLGAILAFFHIFKKDLVFAKFISPIYLAISILAYISVLFLSKTHPEIRNIWTEVIERLSASVMCFFLIAGAVTGYKGVGKWVLINPLSLLLGKISYGLYIYHNFVFNYYHTPPTHFTIRGLRKIHSFFPVLADSTLFQLAYYFGLTFALALVSWYLIEKPINQLKKHFEY